MKVGKIRKAPKYPDGDYYDPRIGLGDDGELVVEFKEPDKLTPTIADRGNGEVSVLFSVTDLEAYKAAAKNATGPDATREAVLHATNQVVNLDDLADAGEHAPSKENVLRDVTDLVLNEITNVPIDATKMVMVNDKYAVRINRLRRTEAGPGLFDCVEHFYDKALSLGRKDIGYIMPKVLAQYIEKNPDLVEVVVAASYKDAQGNMVKPDLNAIGVECALLPSVEPVEKPDTCVIDANQVVVYSKRPSDRRKIIDVLSSQRHSRTRESENLTYMGTDNAVFYVKK